ncbi:MAG TPA: hypothetical protein VGI40_18090 [Pirellulaceae bacterium]
MEVKIEDGFLIVKLPLQEPAPSSTGKTLVVASTHGNVLTTATVGGKLVTVGCNAYIKAEKPGAVK